MKDAIVLYPAPGMGHVVSMVELGKLILILRRHYNPNFSINILITTGLFDTPSSNSYLHGISQKNPSITFHRFPHLSVDTSLTRSRAAVAFEFIRLNASNVRHSLQQISETSTVRALVIDFFCTSALPIAADLGIPTYYFFTSGAAALAAYLYFPTIDKQTTGSFKDLVSTELHVPGLPPFRATHMPEPVLDRDDPAYQDVLYFSLHLPKSKGIIVNTFEELEPIAIKAIADGLCVPDAPTPPIYHIGPLIAEADNRASTADETDVSSTTQHECLSWLDLQPSRSVVFLCFGSRGSFSVEQVKEIADGLERSGQRFLWVVRNPPLDDKSKQIQASTDFDINRIMPEGFLERTKDRGMVVESWAPQVAVLGHESVGGFVTHCGWNSVLEAVVAGVPMVAWPLYAEQHLNEAALVEDMKMANPVEQKWEEDGFVSGAELERGVRELMDSESGRELRERSLKMRERASAAWEELGSSTTALAYLAQLWSETKVQVPD